MMLSPFSHQRQRSGTFAVAGPSPDRRPDPGFAPLNRFGFLRRYRLAGLLILVLCLLGPSACIRRTPVVHVPIKQTAAEQFQYAQDYRESKNVALIADQKRFLREREIIRQIYIKVFKNFPDDRVFNPMAKLWVIEMDAGFDFPAKVEVSERHLLKIIENLQELAEAYPEHDFIQAKTLFNQGACYLKREEYADAQQCLQLVISQYENHTDQAIHDLAALAKIKYDQTYINE